MWNLLAQELKNRRKGIIGWSIALAVYSFLLINLYATLPPEVQQINMDDIAIAQAFGGSGVTSFEGYIAVKVLGLLPILLGIYAILSGTGALIGEEENGTLELMVSWPIPRWQIVIAKALSIATSLITVSFVMAVAAVFGLQAVQAQLETQVTAVHLFLAFFNIWSLAVYFAFLALMLGAFLPSRRSVYNLVSLWLIFGYLSNNLAMSYEPLQKIQPLIPFYYLDTSAHALLAGIQWSDTLLLAATAVAFLLLAVLGFQRRDITVGAWPWQRAHLPQ